MKSQNANDFPDFEPYAPTETVEKQKISKKCVHSLFKIRAIVISIAIILIDIDYI